MGESMRHGKCCVVEGRMSEQFQWVGVSLSWVRRSLGGGIQGKQFGARSLRDGQKYQKCMLSV